MFLIVLLHPDLSSVSVRREVSVFVSQGNGLQTVWSKQ
jgi:hypothetical protein